MKPQILIKLLKVSTTLFLIIWAALFFIFTPVLLLKIFIQ